MTIGEHKEDFMPRTKLATLVGLMAISMGEVLVCPVSDIQTSFIGDQVDSSQ
jgi:hypothetical protein